MALPPPQSGMTPQQYYMTLIGQGVRSQDAYAAVQQNFGPPKTPEEQAKERAGQQQNAAIVGTIGSVAGLATTVLVYDWAKKAWKDLTTGQEVAKKTVETAFNEQGIPYSQSGKLTITRPLPPQTTVVDGSQAGTLDLSGDTTVIDTSAGPQEVPVEAANDPEFLSSVDWGAAGQLGLGALQIYGAYKAYKSGDKPGAALVGATGAVNTYGGAAQLAAGQGATYAGAETLSQVLPGLNIAAGAYGGYKTAQMIGDTAAGAGRTKNAALGGAISGASLGAGIGSFVPVVGTAIGAGIGAAVGGLAGAVGSWTGSGKGQAQVQRDQVRSVMKDAGILDDKYLGTLADGSKFDFGVDGKPLSWKEFDKRIEETPSYNDTVALTGAMVTGMGLSGRSGSDINLLFSRAAQSNAGDDYGIAKNNVLHFANQLGITSDVIKASTQKLFDENNISQSQYDTFMSLANQFPAGQSSSGLENAIPAASSAAVPIRPEEGNALRVSPGLYRIDTGEMIKAKSLRDALEQAYLQRPGKPLEPSQGK
jgi:hypothetical protein